MNATSRREDRRFESRQGVRLIFRASYIAMLSVVTKSELLMCMYVKNKLKNKYDKFVLLTTTENSDAAECIEF
jgi:hypothetical protein